MSESVLAASVPGDFQNIKESSVRWQSPSNLAIVKYWGKYGNQLPQNPSISLTLSEAYTDTKVSIKASDTLSLDFRFEGQKNQAFEDKLNKMLTKIKSHFDFLNHVSLHIESHNTFPHSSGIASSASSMSALALCLCSLENELAYEKMDHNTFYRKASYVSRLLSGSASRSVYPYVAMWGKSDAYAESSNEYAIDVSHEVNDVFKSFHDDILIVSKAQKSVSSTAGHQLMEGNIYALNRYDQARARTIELSHALKTGDIEKFGQIAEDEALVLHALMMCSQPSFILMEANSIEMIKRIRHYRKESNVPVYFSLDAGPNIHLLYPDAAKDKVDDFVTNELLELCVNGEMIKDVVGQGPKKL